MITISDPTKRIPIIFFLNIDLRKNLLASPNLFCDCRSEKQSTLFLQVYLICLDKFAFEAVVKQKTDHAYSHEN